MEKNEQLFWITVIRTPQEFENIKPQWESLNEQAHTYIYQTYEWNRIWWEFFGEGKELYIVLVYQQHRLVGILPLFKDVVRLAGVKIYTCLRFIGSSVTQPKGEELKGLMPYSDYLDMIVSPGSEQQVCCELMDHFKSQTVEFDQIKLEEIPEQSPLLKYCLSSLGKTSYQYNVRRSSVSPIIKLEPTWDDYLKSLSKRSRYHARRFVKFAHDASCQIFDLESATTEEEMLETFDQLVRLHQKKWNDMGHPGSFAEQRMYNFTQSIIRAFHKKGWVIIKKVRPVHDAGDCVAVDLLFKYKNRYYLVHRGMDDQTRYNKWSPGNVLLNTSLEEATNEHIDVFDFLRGAEDFKFRTANAVIQHQTLNISGIRYSSRLKASVIQTYIAIKRQLQVEREHFQLLFAEHKWGGWYRYLKFSLSRIRQKWNERKRNRDFSNSKKGQQKSLSRDMI
ncbi:MAG: GNAT family N-acetyltransferase [Bacteroidota bacterium]